MSLNEVILSETFSTSQVEIGRRRLPAGRFLSFPFPAETDVVVPVLPRSIDVVVVSFVVDLKFPNI